MLRTVRTDYEARNRLGVTVRIFGDEHAGRLWVRDNACLHDCLALHCVEHMVSERRVYRPRASVARPDPLEIPAIVGAGA